VTLDDIRRFAVARSLFPPTTLMRAIDVLGFVQADPIRAPARAQDLTLRHRVKNYRAGDLERVYPTLDLEEGFFINYGFLRRADYLLMHPRRSSEFDGPARRRARAIAAFIREQGTAHPRDIDAHFDHGTATNYWGGSSNATTHLLGIMHYHSVLRVVRRDAGIRVYAVHAPAPDPPDPVDRRARVDALVDIVVRAYAPLPAASLAMLVSRLRYAAPQWVGELKPALRRAKARLTCAHVDGVDWYWPANERPNRARAPKDDVRLLSPFDPIVWDRRRFEIFWGWAYRFEAYTPAPKRKLGYYALPLLWRDRVIGWCNATQKGSRLDLQFGFVDGRPAGRPFARALAIEVERLERFL
jgi:uncharacterized protein